MWLLGRLASIGNDLSSCDSKRLEADLQRTHQELVAKLDTVIANELRLQQESDVSAQLYSFSQSLFRGMETTVK